MYFWDEAHKRGTIHATSAKASPGSRQGVSVQTGQLGRDLRQGEQTFIRQTWLSRGSSEDAAPGEATAAAAVGDLDQGGRQEREATESALAASDPRCRHHPLTKVQGQVQLHPKLLGVCRRS